MPENPLKRLMNRRVVAAVRPASRSAKTPRYGVETRRRRERKPRADRQPGPLARVVNDWWNRLIGAVFGGKFSEQTEQYLAHQTTRDYVCNTAGQAAWGMLFPVLTMVATWLVGAEQAGLFSMAFTVGTLLLFLANYGVRTYQVSDLDEMRSFLDYQIQRFLTCAAMLLVGWLWCRFRGYDAQMFAVCMGVLAFRAVDGLADVYEGRLQQKDKLYLAGLSQAARCVLGLVAFSVILFLTRSLPVASFAMAVGGVASLLLLTVPLAFFETEKSLPATARGIRDLFVECFPLFLALFLYNLIDSVPKFAMEGALSYDNQLYYNALYFPAHSILMVAGFIYKPQLVRLARIWDDPEKHRRFDLVVLAMVGVIALITGAMALFMAWLGIPLMSLMYGLDFEQFRGLALVMVGTGGVCACIDFLYQIVTVLRAQGEVSRLYLIAFAFAVPVSMLLVNFAGLAGAVVGSLVSMAILLVLLVMEYCAIRRRMSRGY
ncbi:lipopolysaccharide biosynthesis protein [Olsenella sp. An293]|uniref:lipopolysaccharide biosynthesis protein n=1 Tax=Olsenella sp. An293 TaxID=1965626 RepID=UPI001EF6B64C|nr:lipopolysaccharide biosynthesis protein [Olsenella sp. An293]